jgi:hypothetical protein
MRRVDLADHLGCIGIAPVVRLSDAERLAHQEVGHAHYTGVRYARYVLFLVMVIVIVNGW